MNYDEYSREGHLRYEAFARTVAAILQAAIDDRGEDFHLQQISCRAKTMASLHRKLKERGLLASQTIEIDLKDLAGCRVVFYTNADVDRFLNSRLISENFKIDFDGSKIHHAVGKDRSAEELYFAIHYLPPSRMSGWRFPSIVGSADCGAKSRFRPFSTTRGRRRRTTSYITARTSRGSARSSSPLSRSG